MERESQGRIIWGEEEIAVVRTRREMEEGQGELEGKFFRLRCIRVTKENETKGRRRGSLET